MRRSTVKGTGARVRPRPIVAALMGVAMLAVIATALPSAAAQRSAKSQSFKGLWHSKSAAAPRAGLKKQIAPKRFKSFSLDRAGLARALKGAPSTSAGSAKALVISLPAPNGKFQRFALTRSQIMAPGLAKKHPDIATYRGRGIDDKTATIHADLSRLGFHASVRSATGAWYIDPLYRLNQSVYASYYGRYMPKDSGTFIERDAESAELAVDKGYYQAADTVTLTGSGFAANADISIGITDPEGNFPARTASATADDSGSFTTTFVADPDGNLETRIVTATDGAASASASYQVVRDDDPTVDPPTGDVLRTYRLALITDPGYSAYHGGPANVTAAKVTLMNRVSQVYEDDLSITMQLIANNDLLNLNTWDAATAPNGPCGAAACFAQSNVTGCSSLARNRVVIGQIIGASNYDIGHLALGQPGGGVANLGVVGRAAKAQGCTGIPTPTGDFYAIDYVAHEMGHQFSGNHPFNGNQLNCSGGNRSAATSVEPGSGSSIMAYAGICSTDDLAAHSDPYFSQRSLQEISTYTSSNQAAINEVQSAALRHYGGGNEVQVATFGPGFQQANAIQPLTVAIGAPPSTTQLGGLSEDGNLVTVSTGAAGATHTLQPGDSITISGAGDAGYNGTFTVNTVLTSRAFTYINPVSGLPRTGGGTITLNAPGLSEVGNTVTVRTTLAHNRSVGDQVDDQRSATTPATTRRRRSRSPRFRARGASSSRTPSPAAQRGRRHGHLHLAVPAPLGRQRLRPDRTGRPPVHERQPDDRDQRHRGLPRHRHGDGRGLDRLHGHVHRRNGRRGRLAAVVRRPELRRLLREHRRDEPRRSERLVRHQLQRQPVRSDRERHELLGGRDPGRRHADPAGRRHGDRGRLRRRHLQQPGLPAHVRRNARGDERPGHVRRAELHAGRVGLRQRVRQGRRGRQQGGSSRRPATRFPVVTAPATFTIPLRTPFALTGSATDADGDPLLYSWEQNDRGGTAGTSLLIEHEDERRRCSRCSRSRRSSARRTRSSTTRRARTT